MANPLPVEDSLKEEQIAERQRRLVASLPRTSDEKILLAGVCSQLLDAQFRAEETLLAMKGITIPPGEVDDVTFGLSAMGMYHFSPLSWTDSRNYLIILNFSFLVFTCRSMFITYKFIASFCILLLQERDMSQSCLTCVYSWIFHSYLFLRSTIHSLEIFVYTGSDKFYFYFASFGYALL